MTTFMPAALSLCLTFWWYCIVRGMSERVGLQPSALLFDACVALFAIAPAFFTTTAALRVLHQDSSRRRMLSALLVGWLIAVCTGETTMLLDEKAFSREAAQAASAGAGSYVRARRWPNGNASLVWDRSTGIHATN